jgi:hypothetical protein
LPRCWRDLPASPIVFPITGEQGVGMGHNGIRRLAFFLLLAVMVYAAATGMA